MTNRTVYLPRPALLNTPGPGFLRSSLPRSSTGDGAEEIPKAAHSHNLVYPLYGPDG